MANYLEQVRAAYPDLDKNGYSDEEVAIWLADRSGRDRQEIGEMLGVYDPSQGDFSRGISSAVDSTQGMAYAAGALAADTFGADGARNSMLRGYQKNMSQVELRSKPTDSYEGINSFGNAVDFAQYYSGYGLAQGAQAIASGGLGGLIGKQVVKQGIKGAGKDLLADSSQAAIARGGKVGGYAGFGGQAVGTELGATYGGAVDRALDNGESIDDINLGPVYGYGTAAGLMEGVADVATAGLARLGPAKNLMEVATKTRARGAVTGAAKGSAVEGFTEGVQTGLEDLGAGYSAEEARFFDPTAVLAGAIGGGQLGAAGGLLQRPQQSGTDTNEVLEVAKDNVGEQLQMDLDDPSTPEQLQAQYDEQQRKADAIIKLDRKRQDANNEAIRAEGEIFDTDEFRKQIAAGVEASVADRTSDLGREFLDVLNTPTEDGASGIFGAKAVKKARDEFIKDKVAAQEGSINQAYEAELVHRVTEKAKNQDQIALDFDQKTPEEKLQIDVDKPALSGAKAIEQTERMFGKDWVASGNYEALEAAVNAPKFNRKKYAAALGEAVNPSAPTPVNASAESQTEQADTPLAETTSSAFLDDSEVRAELKPQQQKVYDAVLKAANDNTLGDLFSVTFESGDTNTQSEPEANTPTPGSVIKARRTAQRKILKDAGVKEKTILDVFKTKKVEPSAADVSKFESVGGITSQAQPRRQAEQVSILEAAGVSSDIVTLFKEAAGKQSEKKAPKERGFKVEANNALLKSLSGITNQQSAATATSAVVSKLREKYGNDGLREMLIQSGVSMGGGIEVADTATANDLLAEGGAATGTISSAGGSQSAGAASKMRAKATETKLMKAAGMTAEDIKSFYAIESTVPELAETDGDAATRAAEEASLGAMSGILAQSWDSSASRRNAPLFDDLTMDQKIDWMHYANAADASNAIDRFDVLDKQQREIERAATSETETQNEQVSEPQTEERNEDKRDTRAAESTSGGSSPETASNADAGPTPQGSSTEEASTGVVGGVKTAPVVEVKKRKKIVNKPSDTPASAEKTAEVDPAKNQLMPTSFATGQAFVADAYHGTTTDIVEFDNSRLGENTGAASAAEAFFFAGKGATASTYAENTSPRQKEAEFNKNFEVAKKWFAGKTLNDQDQKTLSAMLDRSKELKNGETFVSDLVDLSKKNPGATRVYARKMAQSLVSAKRPQVQMRRIRMSNPLVKDFNGAKFRDETYASLIKQAKAAGHDGVVLLNTYDVSGKLKKDLTEADMDTIFGVFEAKDITTTFKVRSDNTKFSKKTARGEASTVARVTATADIMFGGGSLNTRAGVKIPVRSGNAYSRIQIHATEKDALRALKGSMTREDLQNTQGFIDPRDGAVAHYIAENITVGEEAGVLAHEVGVHLGLEGVMDASGISKLSSAIDDWANEAEGSTARNIYDAVGVRIAFARLTGMDESLLEIEKIAYAVEEAINMGVSPDKVSQDKAAKWLADIQQFFSDLLARFMSRDDPDPFFGLPAPVLEPTELVALAMGAARGVMNSASVETGAVTSDMDQVAGYYGGTDRGRSLDEDAKILSSERPGEELFSWGENSSIGGEKNILTVAEFDRSGMDFQAFAGNNLDSFSILTVSLSRISSTLGYDNLYEVAVYGPMNGDTKTLDLDGRDWSRLEGVSRKDTIRVLTEARRRMTRHLSGAIPNLVWSRVTGSSAKTGEARQGSQTAEELKLRFSRAPQNQTPDQKASGVAKREWVRSNLGGTNAVKAYDTASGVAAKAALSLKFVHNIVRDNRESMPSLGRWYDAMLQVEATRNEIKQSYNGIKKQARALSSERRVVVNKFLGSSTFDQQWGYDPKEYHPDLFGDKKVEVNAGKRIQFQRLSASEKQLITDIFAHGERMRQRKVALAKKLGVAGKFFTDASLEGPYAPLKRFGNYVAELKSAKLVEAGRAAKADGATKKQKELYEELKSDREHYVISFFDTEGAANQFVDENKKTYAFSPPATERTPNIDKERVSNPEVYEKVMGALAASTDASMDPSAKTAFRELVKSMYFQSMDERSARTSGTKRLNRAGYEENMLRSFESNASAEASLIAQMENGTEVNTALALAGNETRIDPNDPESIRDTEKQRVFNNIAKHYADTLTRNETPVQDMISTGNSVYMLLTSVGYHLTNATQPVMVSIPRIAGDFGSYSNAWSAMFRGYKYSRAAAKIGLNMETEIDFDKVPSEYRSLLKLLQDRNLIDQGMEEDGSFNRFNTGFEVLNRGSDMLGTATGKLYNVAKFVEAQNRISTAIAAYDAARANPTKLAAMKMTPEQYATAVVEDTQGNFSQLDAPSLIKSLPKVVTQYRKYQLLMAWHYASAYKQIRWGSPEEKAAGKRILAYSIGHAAMGAGATGVPLLTTAFWLATFLGDEDEPQDMERWIKENIDDGAFGQALSRGVFSTFGLDLSTKLNQSKIFHPLPYVDFEAGEEGARNIIMGAVGPAGTTGVNFFRAAEYFKQGDLLKGIEYSMPKGIRSVAESYRLATEGMTTKSGTITVDPREFDVTSLLINAMGLPSSEINRLKWTKGQQYELEQYFNRESGKIRKNYIEATRRRDRDAQADMRQEFRDLQKAKDRVRPFFNDAPGALNRQSISTLLRAPRAKDRLEAREQEKLR